MSWKIRKQTGACAVCARVLRDGEEHFSLIRLAGEEVAREDRCLGCWSQHPPSDQEIFWKALHQLSPRQKRAIDFGALREIFLQLCERPNPEQEALHYLVALLLVRKKILKIRELRRKGDREVLLLGFPRNQDSYEIQVPDLSADRIESLKKELQALFESPSEEPASEAAKAP